MAQVIEIPILLQRRYANELAQFQLSAAVHDRLHFLLDRQDAGTQLSDRERLEAEGLSDDKQLTVEQPFYFSHSRSMSFSISNWL